MLLNKLKFRNKLLVSFLLVFVPLILGGSFIAYYQVKKIIQAGIEKELNQTTSSLSNLIQTSAAVSIKNRLQAIAEKNMDIVEYYYSKHRSGLLTLEEALKIIEEIFLHQSIGISGYIYCLDSSGQVIIHPNAKVKGTNVSKFDFVQEQTKIKDGYLEYDWKNPGELHERPKALYMVYYKPLDWIISVSTYRDEFTYLVDINDFKNHVLSFKSGETGYAFILDETGRAIVHPNFQGINLLQQAELPREFIQQLLSMKQGKLQYFWQNPGEAEPREKIVIFKHLPEFNWIIGSTSYVKEVFSPLKTFKLFLALGLGLILVLTVWVTFLISRSVTSPLEKLIEKLEAGIKGDFSIRMVYDVSDELGKLAGHFNSFMDQLENYHEKLNTEIQKTIHAQAALKENELKLRGIFNQSFQLAGILSPQGILEEVNQTALDFAQCTEAEVLSKPFWTTPWWRHDTKSQSQIKNAIQRALKGELVRLETTNQAGPREVRYLDVSIKPVYNDSGSIEFLIVEGRDITELKQTEAERHHLTLQLEKSQRMEAIGTLAGGIAHDFNNILSSIFGYAQLAEMSLNTPEKAERHIAQIFKGAQRAANLVQQILTFSRQTDSKKHPLKIHLVVKEALKLLRSSIPTTIDIKTQINSNSMVMADPTQMHQVIMNLCTNAFHSMLEAGGILQVRLEDIDPTQQADQLVTLPLPCTYIKLEVMDTGHGMDEKILKKAFDPYFTTKEVGRGTGFGLALVHGIVADHEGLIHVQSAPGKGSCFSIFLPIVERESLVQSQETKTLPVGGSETIMVVDDEPAIRMVTTELLQAFGYTVHSFENGELALKAFTPEPDQFDLIITDMTMPRMTGAELARRVLAIRNPMPIILCTGYSEAISDDRARELGIRRYLQKPVQNQDLLAVIREILDAPEQTNPW